MYIYIYINYIYIIYIMIIVIDDNARFKSKWREIVIRMKIERDRIFENMGKRI